jgi:hypothetical protein
MNAGYSGTPLPKKLGIKEGSAIALINAPRDLARTLGVLPAGVTVADGARKAGLHVIVVFVDRRADLARRFGSLARKLDPAGGLWVAWPKRASGVPTDLTEDVVREIALAEGLVDNKVCAIDDTWSGLRCVIRVENRLKPARKR